MCDIEGFDYKYVFLEDYNESRETVFVVKIVQNITNQSNI